MAWHSKLSSNVALGYKKILGRVAPSLTGAVNQAKGVATRVAAQPHLTAGAVRSGAMAFATSQKTMLGGAATRVMNATRSGYAQGGIAGAMKAGSVVGGRAFRSLPSSMRNGAGIGMGVGAAYGFGTKDSSGRRGNISRAMNFGMVGALGGYAGAGIASGMKGTAPRKLLSQFSSAGNEMRESYSSMAQAMGATAKTGASYESRLASSGSNAFGTRSSL